MSIGRASPAREGKFPDKACFFVQGPLQTGQKFRLPLSTISVFQPRLAAIVMTKKLPRLVVVQPRRVSPTWGVGALQRLLRAIKSYA